MASNSGHRHCTPISISAYRRSSRSLAGTPIDAASIAAIDAGLGRYFLLLLPRMLAITTTPEPFAARAARTAAHFCLALIRHHARARWLSSSTTSTMGATPSVRHRQLSHSMLAARPSARRVIAPHQRMSAPEHASGQPGPSPAERTRPTHTRLRFHGRRVIGGHDDCRVLLDGKCLRDIRGHFTRQGLHRRWEVRARGR